MLVVSIFNLTSFVIH